MIIVGILGIIIIGAVLVGPVMSNVENPSYEVIQSDKKIEIRKYQPMIVAQIELEGNRKEAIQLGFRVLADYIFGSNSKRSTKHSRGGSFMEDQEESLLDNDLHNHITSSVNE